MNYLTEKGPDTSELLKGLVAKAGLVMTVAAITQPYIAAIVSLAPDVGRTLMSILQDFLQRPESPRRSRRLLTATQCIVEKIGKRLELGDLPRQDGFFESHDGRSKAEELYEAVVEASIKQFEERKVPYISNIFSYAVFHVVPASTVNSLLQQAAEKTWRHFCLLALLSRPSSVPLVSRFFAIPERDLDPHGDEPHLRADLERLHGRATGLITESNGQLALSLNGRLFVDCAGLSSLDDEELAVIERSMEAAVEHAKQ